VHVCVCVNDGGRKGGKEERREGERVRVDIHVRLIGTYSHIHTYVRTSYNHIHIRIHTPSYIPTERGKTAQSKHIHYVMRTKKTL